MAVRTGYTEKRQRSEIKVYIEKRTLKKLNKLTEKEFVGLSFKSAGEHQKTFQTKKADNLDTLKELL